MLILAAISSSALSVLMIVSIFLAAGSLAWFAMDFFAKDAQGAAEDRLDMLNMSMRKEAGVKQTNVEKLTKALEQASPAISKHMVAKTEAERNELKMRLTEAGFRFESATAVFLTIKVLAAYWVAESPR